MNEVEKMYENVGLFYCNKCRHDSELDCIYMCESKHPPFTAEKQISLIIFLSYKYNKGLLINLRAIDKGIDIYDFELFGECLAKLVNELWQDLSEEEHKQIKEILC